MQKTEAQILAGMMDQTRKLARYYIGKLLGVDVLKEFEVEGKKLNCVLWLIAHITWAEHALLLETLNGPQIDMAWIGHFRTNSSSTPQPDWPPLDEVLQSMKQVHETAMKFVSSLDDKSLDEPAYIKATDWNTDKRHVIIHAIRHEGIHIGHLTWLCKLHSIKTL